MPIRRVVRSVVRGASTAAALAAAGYGAYAGVAWSRYGRPARPHRDEEDEMLDRLMPAYDVVERHHVDIAAPAAVTLEVASNLELTSHPLVRAVFKGREVILGATPSSQQRPKGLVDEVLSLGWVVLAEAPGREIVLGSVTKPWEPNVTVRPVPPDAFAAFNEPGYVKIAWTLRADPLGADRSIFRTETRAIATDDDARRRFRLYWSFVSPGIWLIRRMSLAPIRTTAERRAAA